MIRRLVYPTCGLALCLTVLLSIAWAGQSNACAAEVIIDPGLTTVGWGESTIVTVMYDGTGVEEGLRGFHVEIVFDDELVFLSDPGADIVEGSFLSDVGTTAFLRQFPEDGAVIVDCAILGPTSGAFGVGELVTLRFTGRSSGEGMSPLQFSELDLRDTLNVTISSTSVDGEIMLVDTPVEAISWSRLKVLFL